MAQLTLNWSVGRYRIETDSALSSPPKISTLLSEIGDIEQKWIVREGAATDKPAHKPDAIYEQLANCEPNEAGILTFVNKYGLLWSRGKREEVEKFLTARRELKKLLVAKKRDDWDAASKWIEARPKAILLSAGIGYSKTDRPQLEFRPQNLIGLIVSRLIQDWSSGVKYEFCKRPGCGEYFYYGSGTDKRETADYCSPKCQNAHAYAKRKEKKK